MENDTESVHIILISFFRIVGLFISRVFIFVFVIVLICLCLYYIPVVCVYLMCLINCLFMVF